MAVPFLEERLSVCVRIGAAYDDSYFVEVVKTAGGGRYPSLLNGKPYREFDVGYLEPNSELAVEVANLYHRSYGGYAGFRARCWDDHTTANDGISPYTSLDCTLEMVSPGVYQLAKEYGRDKPGLPDIGRPRRIIYKPVPGEAVIAVKQLAYPNGYTVDYTTGLITLAANKTRAITGITQAASAVLTVGTNTFAIGESVVISGVVGMTQINGLRALITAKPSSTTITLAINSTGFTSYASGGTVQTQPLNTGTDLVTGGCEFDIPCAFASTFSVTGLEAGFREVSGQKLEEILNPLD